MASTDFISRLRSGLTWFNPHIPPSGGPPPDGPSRRPARWLTPAIVEGFDPAAFPSLSAAERDELSQAVARFRGVAERVPDAPAPTAEQQREAAAALADICRLLDSYLFDPEGRQVFDLLWELYPTPQPGVTVDGFDFELVRDQFGDPVAKIWMLVPDDLTDGPGTRPFARRTFAIESAVRQKFERAGVRRQPFVFARTVSDHCDVEPAA